MGTPTTAEAKIAKVLKDHQTHIREHKSALAAQEQRLLALETRQPKQAPAISKTVLWSVAGGAAVVILTLLVLLISTRSQVHELTARMDAAKPPAATDAEIRARIDAMPAQAVASALAPVKRRKRVDVDAAANQTPVAPAVAAPTTGAAPADGGSQ